MGDLMFRDVSASMARRASAPTDTTRSNASLSPSPSSSPDRHLAARTYFNEHMISDCLRPFYSAAAQDDLVAMPMLACGLAAISNRKGDVQGRQAARRCYVDAIAVTNATLRDPAKVTEDKTLVAVFLLGLFEVP